MASWVLFFFQAEDGIRDLVRSRGLGDVYKRQVVVLGAAGRDFHNVNVVFRNDPAYRVVAFTATQILSLIHI